MTVIEIKRIIEEMISDIKLDLSLARAKYDFYIARDKEKALTYAHSAFLCYRKIDELRNVDVDKLAIDTLQRIEEYIVLLRKEDVFSLDEINAFIKIVNEYLEKAHKEEDICPLPSTSDYVDGSFRIDDDFAICYNKEN